MHINTSQSWNKQIETIHNKLQMQWFYPNFEGLIVSKIKHFCKYCKGEGRLIVISLSNKEFNYQPSSADFKGVF